MNNKKDSPAFNPTITAQTKDGHTVEIGAIAPDFSVKLFPGVNFADLAHNTVLGDPNNMHITTGCIRSKSGNSTIYDLDEEEVTP